MTEGRPSPPSYSFVVNRGLTFRNPIDVRMVDKLIDVLELAPGQRMVDIGCGGGELLIRVAQRHGTAGTGIDRSSETIAYARELAQARAPRADLVFHAQDAGNLRSARGAYDLAACVGARAALGRYDEALARLRDLAGPRGQVLLGETYWLREPTVGQLTALGVTRDTLPTLKAVFKAGIAAGLVPRYAVTSGVETRDRYLWTRVRNCERYAVEHPGDAGAAALCRWAWTERGRHVGHGGRDVQGFGLFLFARDR